MYFKGLSLSVMAASSLLLAACGGGSSHHGSSSPSTPPAPVAGSETGVLTDSAIEGVQYTTSSGYSGITSSDGHFNYNPGETVTFKLGSLVLGTVTATGSSQTITPLELATADGVTDADKVANLLVLLQSLDSDGDASNGITIVEAVRNTLTSSVADELDLTQDPTNFASEGNSALSGLIDAAGEGAGLVDLEDAQSHFSEQFFTQLNGTWLLESDDGSTVVIRFDAQGHYMMGEVGTEDDSGGAGIESGFISWDPLTGEMTAGDIIVDTNGEWGFSHPNEERIYLSFQGDDLHLVVKDGGEEENITLTRVAAADMGVVGTWGVGSGTLFDVQQFVFLNDGRYFMLDPIGDDQGESACGDAGIEFGHYAITDNVLVFSEIEYDTNGCAGVHDTEVEGDDGYAALPLDGLDNANGSLTLPPEEDEGDVYSVVLYRAGIDPLPSIL